MANLKQLNPGKIPDEVNVVIEIPQGSRVKYELCEETGVIKVDRILSCQSGYPANYGFIPSTLFDDGDPLDVVLITNHALSPGVLVSAKPIGVMKMIDSGEADDKIICVLNDDPQVKNIKSLDEVPQQVLKEIEVFFSTYKDLEGKQTSIDGFQDKDTAVSIIQKSIEAFGKKVVI